MTDRSSNPWGAVASLLQAGRNSDLKWKVLLAIDFKRAHLIANTPFEELSPAGQSKAASAGYALGDTVVLEVRAELDRAPVVLVPSKNEPVTIHWVAGLKEPASQRSGASKTKAGGCFVATAAFGSPLAAEIGVLRHLRDAHLARSAAGTRFLRWYAVAGPQLALVVERSRAARILARAALRVACRTLAAVERTRRCSTKNFMR